MVPPVSPLASEIADAARHHRWLFLLRGILAIVFGVLAIMWPGATLIVLMAFIAAYALVDGIIALSAAARLRRVFARWWLVLIQGLIGVAFGIWAFIQPALSLWYIVISVSLWMFFAAMAQFALGGAQRAMGGKPVWAILGGIVSLAIGVLALAFPGLTVVAAIAMVAWLSLLGGVLNLIVAFSVGSIGGRSAHATA